MKKITAILMALLLTLALSVPALAAGTGTITVQNALEGKTYTLYKVFDLTYSGENISYTYTRTAPNDAQFLALTGSDSPFELTSIAGSDVYSVTKKASATAESIGTFLSNHKDALTQIDWKKATASGTLTFENLDLGYYFLDTDAGTAVTITNAKPNATVVDKNESATLEKKVSDRENEGFGDSVNVQIGDTVYYKVSGKLAHFIDGDEISNYTFTDEMDAGLTLNPDSVKLTIAGTVLTGADDYTLTAQENGFTLNLPNKEGGDFRFAIGAQYELTYSATLNGNAEICREAQRNVNTMTMTWNNRVEGLEKSATVYTYRIRVKKVDAQENETILTGAKFKLYDAQTGGNEIPMVKVDDTTYRVATPSEKAVQGFASAQIEAGEVVVNGLDKEKTYYLEETQAPQGYNPLTQRQAVSFGDSNEVVATVENGRGTELPSTGGIGTGVFYVVGGLLMAAAAVILVARKKVNSEK